LEWWSPLSPAATGVAGDSDAHPSAQTRLLVALAREGYVAIEGLRYEDFLPISAAGIFASNLQQYGTQSTAHAKPTYTQAQLEEVLGRTIIDPNETYAALEAESRAATLRELALA
jgi:uncharacterized glyoxalase superfamily metalloenzyme YdcJ